MVKPLPYDETDPLDIERYAKQLIGKNFRDILIEEIQEEDILYEKIKYFDNPRSKGSLGNLIEEFYFYYQPNSESEADFSEAGVELKVTPYVEKKSGGLRAGERLVLGMIPNNEPIPDDLESSHILEKINLMLLILYHRNRELKRTQYSIDFVSLLSLMSEELKDDFETLKDDYKIIRDKIVSGRAHELSESDTMYLGACTKGSTAKKSLQPQYYNPDVPAKRRAFSLKQGYMTYLLNTYIQPGVVTYQEINHLSQDKNSFETFVYETIKPYIGKTFSELKEIFNFTMSSSKDHLSLLTLQMLGVKGNHAEEFEKSNTLVKTIEINEKGGLNEHMSFPAIKFLDFVEEEWEDSWFYNYFSETRFLFAVYQKLADGDKVFKGVEFWHMPTQDLDEIAYHEWLDCQKIISTGVEFTIKGSKVCNNLLKPSQTKITHLRPHASQSAYRIDSLNFSRGNIQRDADRLPNGDWMTKQGFWLNKNYLIEQLEILK